MLLLFVISFLICPLSIRATSAFNKSHGCQLLSSSAVTSTVQLADTSNKILPPFLPSPAYLRLLTFGRVLGGSLWLLISSFEIIPTAGCISVVKVSWLPIMLFVITVIIVVVICFILVEI